MGYRREPTIYTLVFDDPEFEGLEVKSRSISLGKFLAMEELIGATLSRENVEQLFTEFVGILVSWNLEDEAGNPVPVTVEGLYSQDLEFVRKIIDAWKDAMTGVADPLPQTSGDGGQSLEASIPMETLSENRAS